MTLRELCDPLFLYVCKLNRSARNVSTIGYERARAEIDAIFTDMRAGANAEPGLATQYEAIELPLMFFVDSLIAESKLPYAAEWHQNRLAFDRNELAGDEKFFDILDETLAEKSEAATDRLEILCTCLGLGFEGWYAGQPEYLKRKMMDLAVPLRNRMDGHDSNRICPDTYEHTNTANLIQPPGARLFGIGLVLVGLVALILCVNFFAYARSTDDLRDALRNVEGVAAETNGASGS